MRAVAFAASVGLGLACCTGAASVEAAGTADPQPRVAATSWVGEAHYSFTGVVSSSGSGSGKATLDVVITPQGTRGSGSIQIDVKRPFVTGCPGVTLDRSANGTYSGPVTITFEQKGPGSYVIGGGNFGIPVVEHVTEPVAGNSCETRASDRSGTYYLHLPGPILNRADLATAKKLSDSYSNSGPQACHGEGETSWDSCTVSFSWSLERTCDPELFAKAQRELAVAHDFAEAGIGELGQATNGFRKFRNDYAKESVEVVAEKLTALDIVKTFSEDAALALEVTAFYVAIGVTIEELYTKIIPAFREERQLLRDAKKDFDRAAAWNARGEADLKRALADGPCLDPVEARLNKALEQQRAEEQARKLIDSWENNGYLYLNPTTGEVLDEAAALKQARAALAGTMRKTQSTYAPPRRTATRAQVRSALAAIERAQAHHRRAAGSAARFQASLDRLRAALKAILR